MAPNTAGHRPHQPSPPQFHRRSPCPCLRLHWTPAGLHSQVSDCRRRCTRWARPRSTPTTTPPAPSSATEPSTCAPSARSASTWTTRSSSTTSWPGRARRTSMVRRPLRGYPSLRRHACMHRHRFPGANYPTRGCIVYPVPCRVTQCLLQHQLLLQKKAPAKKKKK